MALNHKKSMLCVGGPMNGQRYAVMLGSGFAVPVMPPEGHPEHPDYKPNQPTRVELVDYREETLHTLDGDISFWAPKQQTAQRSIELLLEAYEAMHRPPPVGPMRKFHAVSRSGRHDTFPATSLEAAFRYLRRRSAAGDDDETLAIEALA